MRWTPSDLNALFPPLPKSNNQYGVMLEHRNLSCGKIFLSPKKKFFGRRKFFENFRKKSKNIKYHNQIDDFANHKNAKARRACALQGKVREEPRRLQDPHFLWCFWGGPFFFALLLVLKQGGDRVFQHANIAMVLLELALEARVNA